MAEQSLEERQAQMRTRMKARTQNQPLDKIVTGAEQAAPSDTEQPPDNPIAPIPEFGITKDYRGISISREQLYNLVWTEPIVKAAERFQVSDVAVAKACRKHDIPVPGRGYWACLVAGQKMSRPRLPSTEEKGIRVRFLPPRKPDPVVKVKASQTLALEDASKHLHPIAKQTKAGFDKRNLDQQGRCYPNVHFLDVRVTAGQIDRALRILSTLLKAANSCGYEIILGKSSSSDRNERWARLSVDKIPISFNVKERVRQTAHLPTPADQKLVKTGQQYLIPSHDYHPTGELTLAITHPWTSGIQVSWQDGKRQRIEDTLANILETFRVVAEKEQEALRQREIQAKLQAEKDRRRYEEQQRVERLNEQLKVWKLSADVRAYAAAVEAALLSRLGKPDEGSELGQWVKWMRNYADAIDPSTRDDIGRERRYW